jgi:hypothetical protein
MELSLSLVSSCRKLMMGTCFLKNYARISARWQEMPAGLGSPFPGSRPHARGRKELYSIPRADRRPKLLVIGFEMAC